METIQNKIVNQIDQEGESAIQETTTDGRVSKAPDRPQMKIDPKKMVIYSEIMKTKF